jgi:hypothetical protein
VAASRRTERWTGFASAYSRTSVGASSTPQQ